MIGFLFAAQIGIIARAPDTAVACVPFQIDVAVRASGATVPRIRLVESAGLQLLHSRTVSRAERDAEGRPATFTEGTFLVAARAAGRFTLPAVVADIGGTSAHGTSPEISVRPSTSSRPLVLVRATLDAGPARRADSLYVGEQVDYVVDVRLNEAARQRLRHNPTFFPPDMPAVLAYDLAAPGPIGAGGGACFETLSYRRALFPLFAGAVVIPPATLSYSLPLSTSFFSREERFELRTDSVGFVAMDPPVAGRPADFAGAVGRVQATSRLDSPTGRMGDPVVLTLRLAGTGNVKLLPRPPLTIGWATVALGGERVRVDTSAAVVRGEKEFDWLLTPRRAGRLAVPAIRYPFFDPTRGHYDVALTLGRDLNVAAATLASADTGFADRLPIRRALRAEAPSPLLAHGWYWMLLLAAPVPATLRRVFARRRHSTAGRTAARRLRDLGAARRSPSPRALRRGYVEALRERVPGLGAATEAREPLARLLRRAGVTDATAQAAEALLDRLDGAAFSPTGMVDAGLVTRALESVAAVDAEAVRPIRPVPARGPSALALVVAIAFAATAAGMPEAVVRSFDDGVRAYARGDFASAQRLFARSAARAPRATDAWANLGAAAWARDDTAHAVLGWQRALRLDPLDVESRELLAVVQPPQVGSPAYVPPVSVNAVALVAAVLWTAAWLVLALPWARSTPFLRPLAGGALALAIVALAGALELRDRADVRDLGVLRTARHLLDAPSSTGAPVAAVTAGEVGALGVREGVWVRLTIDGARAGWLPVAAVLPLTAAGVD